MITGKAENGYFILFYDRLEKSIACFVSRLRYVACKQQKIYIRVTLDTVSQHGF